MQKQEGQYIELVIKDILASPNTLEKVNKFKSYGDIVNDCRMFLFDEECSNLGSSFQNCKIGQCEIIGAGDYTKTWILDTRYISERALIPVGKTIDFDLNILTYLNKLMIGKKLNIDKMEFVSYLNYLKREGFQCGITTALMERVMTPVDLNILSEMIMSFVKFDNMNLISGNGADYYLSPNDYIRTKDIYDTALQQEDKTIAQFDILCCCVMKAFLIKNYDVDLGKDEKIEKFIRYCLDVLNCYLEKEIVLLSLYISDDSSTHKTFKKLKNNSDIIKNILNVTWDIYHIRLIEQIMFHDNVRNTGQVILSYFATADNGVIDAIKINPLKAFVIMEDNSIPLHKISLNDICKNNDLLEEGSINASIRAKRIQEIDYAKIQKQLEKEISNRQKQSFNM